MKRFKQILLILEIGAISWCILPNINWLPIVVYTLCAGIALFGFLTIMACINSYQVAIVFFMIAFFLVAILWGLALI